MKIVNRFTNINGPFRGLQSRSYQRPVLDRTKLLKTLEELQRNVLVELKANWPVEPTRDDRSIRHSIIARIESDAKRKADLTTEEILQLIQRTRDDLSGAQELIADKSFKELKLKDYVVPEALKKHKTLLTSRAQDKIKKRRWGFVDRFLTWYMGDYKSYETKNGGPAQSTTEAKAEEAKKE